MTSAAGCGYLILRVEGCGRPVNPPGVGWLDHTTLLRAGSVNKDIGMIYHFRQQLLSRHFMTQVGSTGIMNKSPLTEDQMRQCTTCAGKSSGAFLCRFRRSMLAKPGVRAPKNNNAEARCTVSALYPAGEFNRFVSLFLSLNLEPRQFSHRCQDQPTTSRKSGKKAFDHEFPGLGNLCRSDFAIQCKPDTGSLEAANPAV
jgi:hypothetical protein